MAPPVPVRCTSLYFTALALHALTPWIAVPLGAIALTSLQVGYLRICSNSVHHDGPL